VLRWKGKGKISFEGMEVTTADVPYIDRGNSWTPTGSYAGRNYEFTSTNGGRVVNRHFWMIHGWVLRISLPRTGSQLQRRATIHSNIPGTYEAI
jgi:hypothetical protein